MSEHLLLHWQRYVGDLPKGFFLEISGEGKGTLLGVRYNGPGFMEIVQPDGEKPGLEDESAHIGSINLMETGPKVLSFVNHVVLATQEKLRQPVNAQ